MWSRRSSNIIETFARKEESDRSLIALLSEQTDGTKRWYFPNQELGPELALKFFPLQFDQETKVFLNTSLKTSNNLCLQFYYSLASMLLSLFLSKTSVNGFLNRGGMFLFSRNQIKNFLSLPDDWIVHEKKLFDIGAGDGAVTNIFAEFYQNVYATDVSQVMQWRLARRGFKVLSCEFIDWKTAGPYSLITALNLLDRHYDPLMLLQNIHSLAIESNCLVLISLVLPLRPFVEFRPSSSSFNRNSNSKQYKPPKNTIPDSRIPVTGNSFEDHVQSLVSNVFQPAVTGFEVVRWTKLPYLSEGDMRQAFYHLNDAVFLLKAVRKPINTVARSVDQIIAISEISQSKDEL